MIFLLSFLLLHHIASGSSLNVACRSGGGLTLTNGDDAWTVASVFSFPGMAGNGWHRLSSDRDVSSWPLHANNSRGGCAISASAETYTLVRTVALDETSSVVSVTDNFQSTSPFVQGIAFDNLISGTENVNDCPIEKWNMHYPNLTASTCIDVGGKYAMSWSPSFGHSVFSNGGTTGVFNDPPFNPSIFFRGRNAGLGIFTNDERFRLLLTMSKQNRTAHFGSYGFGLRPRAAHTFTWSFVAVNDNEYYTFVNAVRRAAAVPRYTIHGGAWLPYDKVLAWPREELQTYLAHFGVKLVILCGPLTTAGAPWLGQNANFDRGVKNFSFTVYLETLRNACARLKGIDAGVKCLAPFETALGHDVPRGNASVPFPDSVVVTADGSPAGYQWKGKSNAPGHNFIYAPWNNNSYARWMAGRANSAMQNATLDGIYFDMFSYSYSDSSLGEQFRYTYRDSVPWDGISIDMDHTPGNYNITRFKSDLAFLTSAARVEAVTTALSMGGGRAVANGNAGADVDALQRLPIASFWEAILDYSYTQTHLFPGRSISASACVRVCIKFVACAPHFLIDRGIEKSLFPRCANWARLVRWILE